MDPSSFDAHLQDFMGITAGVFDVGTLASGSGLSVRHVPPTDDKPFHYLITDGMRAYRQPVPDDVEDGPARVELVMGLDPHWPLEPERFSDPAVTWPIQLLATLAHFPSAASAWLGEGHTVPNGDPPREYVPGVGLCGALVLPLVSQGPEGQQLGEVRFLGVVPLYLEELQLKVQQGTSALLERFDRNDINEVLRPGRPKVAGGVFDLLA